MGWAEAFFYSFATLCATVALLFLLMVASGNYPRKDQ